MKEVFKNDNNRHDIHKGPGVKIYLLWPRFSSVSL